MRTVEVFEDMMDNGPPEANGSGNNKIDGTLRKKILEILGRNRMSPAEMIAAIKTLVGSNEATESVRRFTATEAAPLTFDNQEERMQFLRV